MNKYGLTALKSAENFKDSYSIIEIWSRSVKDIFETKSPQEKSCPKNTFLGLCEDGLVKGIHKGNYTKSIKNKKYAVSAVDILKINSIQKFTPNQLWNKVCLELDLSNNSQMDVILALWDKKLIGLVVKKSIY